MPLPGLVTLGQNCPNPFNPGTEIRFTLSKESGVELSEYDLSGRAITTLINGKEQAGDHRVRWDGGSQPSGVYFYRLTVGQNAQVQKMILMR